MAGRLKTKPD